MRGTRRRMMIKKKYQVLSYIESNNLSYINTGVYGSYDLDTTLSFENDRGLNSYLLGSRNSPLLNTYLIAYDSYGSRLDFRFDIDKNMNVFKSTGTKHIIRKVSNKLYCDDVCIEIQRGSDYITPKPLYLLGLSTATTITPAPKGTKIYYCKMFYKGKMVRDFIPVRRMSDNKIGMLDKIENKFYTSPNRAEFTGG